MKKRYAVLYDDQCEVCQAGASWLRLLDKHNQVDCVSLQSSQLIAADSRLSVDRCARELHVLGPDDHLWVGGAAVRELARLFWQTRWLGQLAEIAPFRWLSDKIYRFVAHNRYQISKCRGGACRTTLSVTFSRAPLGAFWGCHAAGLCLRIPLILQSLLRQLRQNASIYYRTRRKEITFLDGKLRIFFLGGFPSGTVPLLFGENFWMILYDGLLIDPGGPRMRRSVMRQLRLLPEKAVMGIASTHSHEEHIGNLATAAEMCRVPVWAAAPCRDKIRKPSRLPLMRSLVIGQPKPYKGEIHILGERLKTASGEVEVYPAPGHCDDHVVFYDRQVRLLLSGDAFMSTYFSSPNPDVDSNRWLETLTQLEKLDIELLITGHGQIYTLRPDIPDFPGVVYRMDPMRCLAERRAFLEWLRQQVLSGFGEGLPIQAIEATLFPWNRPWSWENLFTDELARMLSGGEFSRSELVRTFVRRPEDIEPEVYQAACYRSSKD